MRVGTLWTEEGEVRDVKNYYAHRHTTYELEFLEIIHLHLKYIYTSSFLPNIYRLDKTKLITQQLLPFS